MPKGLPETSQILPKRNYIFYQNDLAIYSIHILQAVTTAIFNRLLYMEERETYSILLTRTPHGK
jgi:hypothetical protein